MKPNVFVFIIDTLKRDQVRGFGAPGQPMNFLERTLQQGACCRNFFPAGGTTRVSVNAFFNGFLGGTSGFNHQQCQDRFAASQVLTLADVFGNDGYRTLALSQGDISLQPAGFDQVWTRQERFTAAGLQEKVGTGTQPVFAYLHFYGLHDPAFGQPALMTPTNYRRHLDELSAEIEEVWQALVGPQDVVVIASDHGCHLRATVDPTWRFYKTEEPTAGAFLSEQTIGGICSVIGPDFFPVMSIDSLVRGIDIFPTLTDGLGLARPAVQGQSLWPALRENKPWPELNAYVETGGLPLADGRAACRCLRTDRWKYVWYATHGEWLFDLAEDPGERRNLIKSDRRQADIMRDLMDRQLAENGRGTEHFYEPTAALCRQLRARRPEAPRVSPGPREFSFQGFIDDRTRAHLADQIGRQLPRWRENNERIVLYSASEHARAFLEAAGAEGRRFIVGIIDGNRELSGSSLHGVPIRPVAALLTELKPTQVLVAHHHYAQDMYIRLRNLCPRPVPVFSIYHLEQAINLWWDHPAN